MNEKAPPPTDFTREMPHAASSEPFWRCAQASTTAAPELERQLIEMGFTEGARVEILHEGAIGRDPIAVRVDNITIAVRRREAMAVVVL